MSELFDVPEDVKESVKEIIIECGFDPASKITYNIGSEVGDGYLSKTYAVNINNGKEVKNIFLKCPINQKFLAGTNLEILHSNERLFYELIFPVYTKFLGERNVEDGFRNVPRYYPTSNKNILGLENLKANAYRLCDRNLIADEEHIAMVFKTYAKFHAISFAYKDQKIEEYEDIARNITDFFSGSSQTFREKRIEGVLGQISDFMNNLDPVKDKYILDRRDYISERLVKFNKGLTNYEYKHAVITHGDCRCSNILFLYKKNKRTPIDAMLIDWQVIRLASPVFDLSYFFYTAASIFKLTLCKFQYFLQTYHDELSKQIRELGSDPEVLYPFSSLQEEWRKFCVFGYSMAFMIIKAMLYFKDEVPNLEEIGFENMGHTVRKIRRWDEYANRIRNLTYHFLQNNFI